MEIIDNKALYQKIGQTIFEASPDDSVKLTMRASLVSSDEGDIGSFEFDYIDHEGDKKRFPFGSNVDTGLLYKLLTQLRQSHLNQGQPSWNKCEFILDIETGKYGFNINY